MRLNPRHRAVSDARIDISDGMRNILRVLDLKWPEILYFVAQVKLQLLREMGVQFSDSQRDIPDEEHVISSAFYMPMIEHGLTQAELYQLITEWELSEANGLVRLERESQS